MIENYEALASAIEEVLNNGKCSMTLANDEFGVDTVRRGGTDRAGNNDPVRSCIMAISLRDSRRFR
jgi:hypothetical protein